MQYAWGTGIRKLWHRLFYLVSYKMGCKWIGSVGAFYHKASIYNSYKDCCPCADEFQVPSQFSLSVSYFCRLIIELIFLKVLRNYVEEKGEIGTISFLQAWIWCSFWMQGVKMNVSVLGAVKKQHNSKVKFHLIYQTVPISRWKNVKNKISNGLDLKTTTGHVL